MSADGDIQRRFLELRNKIHEGHEAMRELAELQVQLQGPNIVAANGSSYPVASNSAPPQHHFANSLQEAGPSRLSATAINAQQKPAVPSSSSNLGSHPQSVGPHAFSAFRQPQYQPSTIKRSSSNNSALEATYRTNGQTPQVPALRQNWSASANTIAGLPGESEGQLRKMTNAGLTRGTLVYTPPTQSTHSSLPVQQSPSQPQQSMAAWQPSKHVMQVAHQPPQAGNFSSASSFRPNRQVDGDTPLAQNSPHHFPSSTPSMARQPGASSYPYPSQGHSSRHIGPLPEWTAREIAQFKGALESWKSKVPEDSFLDLFHWFKFGEGFLLRKSNNTIFVEDKRDKLRCPAAALYEQLEKRAIPERLPPQPTSGTTTQSSLAQALSQPTVPSTPAPAPPSYKLPSTTVHSLAVAPASTPSLSSQPPPPGPILQATLGATRQPRQSVHSPANANKKTLARDILFALGKRSRPRNEPAPGPATKRPAMGTFIATPPNGPNSATPELVHPHPPLYSAPLTNGTNSPVPGAVLPDPPMASAPSTNRIVAGIALPPLPPGPPSVGAASYAKPSAPTAQENSGIKSILPPPALPAPPAPLSLPSAGALSYEAQCLSTGQNNLTTLSNPVSLRPSIPITTEASGTRQGSNPLPQASIDPTAQVTLPSAPTPIASVSKYSEQTSSSPSLPPIAAIGEVVSSPPRADSPVPVQSPARSPSITISEIAPYPPTSSASNKSSPPDVAEEGPSSPSKRQSSPAISVRSDTSEEPLFLPSGSPSSPEPEAQLPSFSRTSKSAKIIKGKGKERAVPVQRPQHQVYVLVPPPSPRTKRFMQLQHQRPPSGNSGAAPSTASGRSSSRAEAAPGALDMDLRQPAEEDEKEYDFSYDAQGNKIEDAVGRELMEWSCTQLRPEPCKWDRCDVIMNSTAALLLHLKKLHRPTSKDSSYFLCKWSGCGKYCRVKDFNEHIGKHALRVLICPFTGCSDEFRTIGQLRWHATSLHGKDGPRNSNPSPSCKPFVPKDLGPPPAAPDILPSYMGVSRIVSPASISPAQHNYLYPRVLKKVKGAAKRTKPMRLERYAFLNEHRTRHSCYLSEPVENIRVWEMPWNVKLTELCRQDRVTILDEGYTRARIAKAPKLLVKQEEKEAGADMVGEEGKIMIRSKPPTEPDSLNLEPGQSGPSGPVEETLGQGELEQQEEEEEEERSSDTESEEEYSVGAGGDDEAGESELVESMLL